MPIELTHPLILASDSPRRHELLREAGYRFKGVSPPFPEPPLTSAKKIPPATWAESMAYFKAKSVFENNPASIVIGADTIVVHNHKILGKPADKTDARRMLTTLFSGTNQVITGLAILGPETNQRTITSDTTILTLSPMNPQQLDHYLDSNAWQEKAGAYAIQEGGDKFVKSIQGSRSNIVGLPLELLKKLLAPFTP